MDIKKYIEKNGYIIIDGAMGTYYSTLSNKETTMSENANIDDKSIIKKIHEEYIDAGAKLIRTNTFKADIYSHKKDRDYTKLIIENGCNIAKDAVNNRDIYIGASIGPINANTETKSEDIYNEYLFIVDTFISCGINIFIFETFSNYDILEKIAKYIKGKNPNSFILVQFMVMQNGYTGQGVSIKNISNNISSNEDIDAFGFNCGTGPIHIYNNIKQCNFKDKIVSALPNAGFPDIVNRKIVYNQNTDYFAKIMIDIKNIGIKILGGCCGTTPAHIKKLSEKIKNIGLENIEVKVKIEDKNTFELDKNIKKRVLDIAVELDPPFGADISKIMSAAKELKESNINYITISDSPIGKVRVSSMLTATKIQNETGIDVMPHICCRDRNIIGLKSDVLGAYVNGIKNMLVVTGDPIASADRNEIKSVFNLNSVGLIKLIDKLNNEEFKEDKVNIAAALNLNVVNKKAEISKMEKKIEAGAKLFLTQTIFEDSAIEYLINMKKEKGIKIYAGIMPLVSYRNALFLDNEIPGINIPDKYINMFSERMNRDEAEEVGIEIATQIIYKFIDYIDGLYIVAPFNRVNMVKEILKKVNV
ncbi:MAG: bifunctional homocysteine S-methyltransferase/methylenetetrahydrofolate reductase [Fusobacteria bacterium]|nr:bifunctional homocysteine S-methyltransferase/methylenetetrahydrofolate reductase [Fusobacteriota bacterium]